MPTINQSIMINPKIVEMRKTIENNLAHHLFLFDVFA